MAFDSHKNFAYSTVATAPSPAASGTSLVVAAGDGSKFPAAPFNATVWPSGSQPTTANAEIVRVTAISTDTFTISRSQESSSARTIGVGDQIAATITAKTLTDVEAAAGLLHTVSSSGASQTVDYSTANTWDITLTANCTFTLSGFTDGDPDFLTLILRQDATGSRTVTWPTITWIGSGIAPTLQTAANSVDSVVLFSLDGGTTVYGVAQTSASGIPADTSFPASPSDGDLFLRTDRDLIYFYKASITKWLTLSQYTLTLGSVSGISAASAFDPAEPLEADIYIDTWTTTTRVPTTNNGSNFWTVSLLGRTATQGTNTLSSFSTAADTASNYTPHEVTVAALVDSSANVFLQASASSKTGTPGSLTAFSKIVFRYVG